MNDFKRTQRMQRILERDASPKWRKFYAAIVVITVLALIWAIHWVLYLPCACSGTTNGFGP